MIHLNKSNKYGISFKNLSTLQNSNILQNQKYPNFHITPWGLAKVTLPHFGNLKYILEP